MTDYNLPDILRRLERARTGLYEATRDEDRHEDSREMLTDVITKLDAALKALRSKHSKDQHQKFELYLAATSS